MLRRNPTCSPTVKPPSQNYRSVVKRNVTSGGSVVVEDVKFVWNEYTYTHHIAYQKGKKSLPLILVFPNYAGEKQFDIDQAVFLAKCGYTAISVDMYREDAYENGLVYKKRDRNPLKTDSREQIMSHLLQLGVVIILLRFFLLMGAQLLLSHIRLNF